MGKFDFNAMKKQRETNEVETEVPEELEKSYSDLWGSNKEKVEYIDINRLRTFTDNQRRTQPFVLSPEKIEQIKISASDIGILTPLIVRKFDGDYQIISGHHRYEAAKQLKMLTVPCVVREIADNEAVKYVAESNIQRSKLLPTEYAEIYARYLEIRQDIEMTALEIANKFGISTKSLYRYIKILDLTDNLKKLIDNDLLHTDTAEIFCTFSENNQEAVYEYVINENQKLKEANEKSTKEKKFTINRSKAKAIEDLIAKNKGEDITADDIQEMFDVKDKPFKNKVFQSYAKKYNVEMSEDEWDKLISSLLEKHFAEN